MTLNEGDIIPGERIGEIYLGWDLSKLEAYIGSEYKVEDRPKCRVLDIGTAKFWIDKTTNLLTQILVYGDFKGRLAGQIGIGSTLRDVQEKIGPWREELGVYVLDKVDGVCFELRDDEDWDQLSTPIQYISVFLPPQNQDSTASRDPRNTHTKRQGRQ